MTQEGTIMPKNKSYLDEQYWPTTEDGRKTTGFYEQDGKLVAVLRVGQGLHAAVADEREWRIGFAYEALLAGHELTDVPVEGRGTVTLKPHPMAEEFPVMDRGLFVRLVDDVQERGFDTPIELTPDDLILDGRTRAAVAWVTGVEVPVKPFTGSEDEATSKAVAANLLRRHLTPLAQAALALKYLAPALTAEARKRQLEGRKVEGSKRVADQLAQLSDGAFSASTLKRIKGVEEAPDTFARVIEGELTKTSDVAEALEAEIRKDMTPAQKAARTRKQGVSKPAAKTPSNPLNALRDALKAADLSYKAIDAHKPSDKDRETLMTLTNSLRDTLANIEELLMVDIPDTAGSTETDGTGAFVAGIPVTTVDSLS